jgi:hypothetical protein
MNGAPSIGTAARERGRADARKRPDRIEDFVLQTRESQRVPQQRIRSPRADGLNGRRIREAGMNVAQRHERSNHQHRAYHEDESQRDLRDDQRAPRRVAFATRRRAARAADRRHVHDRVLERRDRSEQERRRERDGHGETENDRMNGDFVEPRHVGRADLDEDPQPRVGEQQAERAADRTDHEAFDEQLARQAAAPRAERGAHRELLPACIGPNQHQIRDVRARDEQHRTDRAHEHPERARHAADQVVLQRADDRRDSPILDRVARHARALHHRPRVEPNRQHPRNVGARFVESDAGLESRERLVTEKADRFARRVEPHRDDHIGLRRHVEEAESPRHDADDVRLTPVDQQLAAEGRRVTAEPALPERI